MYFVIMKAKEGNIHMYTIKFILTCTIDILGNTLRLYQKVKLISLFSSLSVSCLLWLFVGVLIQINSGKEEKCIITFKAIKACEIKILILY